MMKNLQFLKHTVPTVCENLFSPLILKASYSANSDDVLIEEKSNGVVTIKLNKPESLNALSVETGKLFEKKIEEIKNNSSQYKCAILTGNGKAFSAGGDIKFLEDRKNFSPAQNSEEMRAFYRRFLKIRELPFPVISCINGFAVGAGMCLALATDIRICSSSAKIGVNFTKLGIHPGLGCSHILPALIGNQASSYMMFTGELISAQRAAELGLVLEVVEPERVLKRSEEIADKIAENSSIALKLTTETLRKQIDQNLQSALQREADAQALCYCEPDFEKGLDSVKKKRKPKF